MVSWASNQINDARALSGRCSGAAVRGRLDQQLMVRIATRLWRATASRQQQGDAAPLPTVTCSTRPFAVRITARCREGIIAATHQPGQRLVPQTAGHRGLRRRIAGGAAITDVGEAHLQPAASDRRTPREILPSASEGFAEAAEPSRALGPCRRQANMFRSAPGAGPLAAVHRDCRYRREFRVLDLRMADL